MSADQSPAVIELITGRWRSQILYTGVALGVFDALPEPASAEQLAPRLRVDSSMLYRLLRALASLSLLEETEQGAFSLSASGECLRGDHPGSLRAMVMLEEGRVHYAAWKHLAEITRSGKSDGFQREFGAPYWDYLKRDPDYARKFSEAMSSYSASEAPAVRRAFRGENFGASVLCDVGGSHGALLAELLKDQPKVTGIVYDLPEVISSRGDSARDAGNVVERIKFVGGDMFDHAPTADAYFLKHILHDWSDADCLRILSVIHQSARPGSKLFLCELIVPGPEQSHFAKIFDVHMMVMQDGRQRTEDELASLLTATGWRRSCVRTLNGNPMSVLEAERR